MTNSEYSYPLAKRPSRNECLSCSADRQDAAASKAGVVWNCPGCR
jgi:hypothetical protein